MIGIYKITNKINEKVYIGQSINIERRLKEHKRKATNLSDSNMEIHLAINEFGCENFEFEILETCNLSQLDERERFWIAKFDAFNPNIGYNKSIGGSGSIGRGIKLNLQIVNEIIDLLKTSQLTMTEISNKYNVDASNISDINTGKIWIRENEDYPIRKDSRHYGSQAPLNNRNCTICGMVITPKASLCKDCYGKSRRSLTIERDTLKQDIRNDTFLNIGKKYSVSETTVRSYCKKYNLPTTKKIINTYSDVEWEKL